jgi:hypothetical protein
MLAELHARGVSAEALVKCFVRSFSAPTKANGVYFKSGEIFGESKKTLVLGEMLRGV